MRVLPVLIVAFGVVALSASNVAWSRERIPVRLAIGAGSELEPLRTVPPDSELGRRFPDQRCEIGYVWENYWVGFPLWNWNRAYVLILTPTAGDQTPELLLIRDEDLESTLKVASLTSSEVSPPLLSRVPFGWFALLFIGAIVKLTHRESPRKRYAKLMGLPEYDQAVRIFLTPPAIEEGSADAESSPSTAEERFERSIAHLVQHRVPEPTARRDLTFLLDYLEANPTALAERLGVAWVRGGGDS